jgi:hypothetical protein
MLLSTALPLPPPTKEESGSTETLQQGSDGLNDHCLGSSRLQPGKRSPPSVAFLSQNPNAQCGLLRTQPGASSAFLTRGCCH